MQRLTNREFAFVPVSINHRRRYNRLHVQHGLVLALLTQEPGVGGRVGIGDLLPEGFQDIHGQRMLLVVLSRHRKSAERCHSVLNTLENSRVGRT